MFESALLLGETERSIDLATAKGRSIKNLVEVHPPPPHSIKNYALLVSQSGAGWKERKPATGRYNCAGHVWASRRTSIFEVAEFNAIIDDDGYRRLGQNEPVLPGDIATYVDQDNRDEILHVGRVYFLAPGITSTSKPIPWIISKWNSTSGESLHSAYDVPYRKDFPNLGIFFLTDRPAA
jgi:hypothetical protein